MEILLPPGVKENLAYAKPLAQVEALVALTYNQKVYLYFLIMLSKVTPTSKSGSLLIQIKNEREVGKMTLKIELIEQKAQPVLTIRTRTSLAELPKAIGETYGEIMQYLTELGEQPADAPYTAYYNLDMNDLDVEMGFPVAKLLPEKGRIKSGEIPHQGKCVSCLYKGSYSQMEQVYGDISKWMDQNNYEPRGVSYEYYYNSPNEVPENELLTKIVIPIK
jgi:effector-binding domain-containing protein